MLSIKAVDSMRHGRVYCPQFEILPLSFNIGHSHLILKYRYEQGRNKLGGGQGAMMPPPRIPLTLTTPTLKFC